MISPLARNNSNIIRTHWVTIFKYRGLIQYSEIQKLSILFLPAKCPVRQSLKRGLGGRVSLVARRAIREDVPPVERVAPAGVHGRCLSLDRRVQQPLKRACVGSYTYEMKILKCLLINKIHDGGITAQCMSAKNALPHHAHTGCTPHRLAKRRTYSLSCAYAEQSFKANRKSRSI